jgi:phosphoribosylformylglycinamidine synthase subunit PurS
LAASTRIWTIEAQIMPKRAVNDPQGEAVLSGLGLLGFGDAQRVRVGKLIRVEVTADNEDEARAMGTEMCDKLLANPVIEEYELSIVAADDQEGRG